MTKLLGLSLLCSRYPIMLCCTAPKIFLLCSTNVPIVLKLCSLNVPLIAKTNHLDCFKTFKYAWVVRIFIISSTFAAIGPLPQGLMVIDWLSDLISPKNLLIMHALCSMLLHTYYAHFNAGICSMLLHTYYAHFNAGIKYRLTPINYACSVDTPTCTCTCNYT